MNKQTKTLLGVAVVLGVGYYLWNQSKKKTTTSFANADARRPRCKAGEAYVGGKCRPSNPFASRTL